MFLPAELGGVLIWCCFFSFGFLASCFLGFSAFCWGWLFASSAFPVPRWQVVFWLLRLFAGLRLLAALAFRILCFPSSSPGFLAFAPFHAAAALSYYDLLQGLPLRAGMASGKARRVGGRSLPCGCSDGPASRQASQGCAA